jgi:small subunit ribosomal protein S5
MGQKYQDVIKIGWCKRYESLEPWTPSEEDEIYERILKTARVSRVIEGGKRYSYQALVVVGDMKGHAGYALAKAPEAPDAIRKAISRAKRRMCVIPLVNDTIPHEVEVKFGASRIVLRPAAPGTGIIGGGTVRAICEVSGIKNILSKSLGSNNPHNLVKAVFLAFSQIRTLPKAAKLRNKSFSDLVERA